MLRRTEPHKIAAELEEPVEEARALARKLGLDPYPVNYWIVNQKEMNELISYGGFHTRYPHWRWGMKYDRQRKERRYLGGKAFEIVNHDDPSNAFLQESNSIADQKAVITHVEAHADFFANNEWFHLFHQNDINAAEMIERHDERISEIQSDHDISREDVEEFIDHLLTIEDNIDQYEEFDWGQPLEKPDDQAESLAEDLEEALDLTEEVHEEVFDEEWLEEQMEDDDVPTHASEKESDLLYFLYRHGKQYDAENEKAKEFEDWQRDVIEIVRRESYYFAPQRMTKVMNEGWAAYWESKMMGDEAFAGDDEFVTYAEHQAKVLNSGGFNPYKLGKELWEYCENWVNRREVIRKLLRVDGITWRNLFDRVDFDTVREHLEPDHPLRSISMDSLDDLEELDDALLDREALEQAKNGDIDLDQYPWKVLSYEGMTRRHFSLTRPQNKHFVERISSSELEELARYLVDIDRYETVDEALEDVDYTAGWDRMRDIRASHNDVTFIDEFLNQEFVDENYYASYEYSQQSGSYHVSSTDYEDVKKKLLLRFTNFGKPTITVFDGNYQNRGELLLAHKYNGVALDHGQAQRVMERLFHLWGRPVNLATIVKEVNEEELEIAKRRGREPEMDEIGRLLRYDGNSFTVTELDDEIEDEIMAEDIDYDTKPEDWL